MDNISNTLTKGEVTLIAQKDDFHIAPLRADGKTFGTPTWIWAVEVNGELFVRAYNGVRSSWYQSAINQGAGKIKAAGLEKAVRFKPVSGSINEKIDEAYRQKYSSSPYLSAMISERTKAATVQILAGH
ncbi:DUF2255 family protein [Fulvivirga sp. 29W222]|uniref:DUF2255 family protein n=1 Tax=Fulvivirga marina TaxID=2494733 RepID=A0A937FYH8_9BACT|nr:DUF2255 family protein [Fulvivirga marina]MBL6448494.1 DUF2255 family protein [Fulvivirga marina]